jgi:hypothetical protein
LIEPVVKPSGPPVFAVSLYARAMKMYTVTEEEPKREERGYTRQFL